jgi:hypothetical protein
MTPTTKEFSVTYKKAGLFFGLATVSLFSLVAGCTNKDQGETITLEQAQNTGKTDAERMKSNEHLTNKQQASAMQAVDAAKMQAIQNAPPPPR